MSQPTTPGTPTGAHPAGARPAPGTLDGGLHHDELPLDGSWPAPWHRTWWDRQPAWLRRLALVLPVLLLVLGLALAGGLRRAKPQVRRVPPGTVVSVGPLEVAVTDGTAHQETDGRWRVVLHASCRNTTQAPIPDLIGLVQAASAVADGSGDNVNTEDVILSLGARSDTLAAREDLPPAAEATPCALTVNMPQAFRPSDLVRVGFSAAARVDNTVLKTGELSWQPQGDLVAMAVPLQIEP